MAFSYKNLVKTPTSELRVGDLIFGSGGLGEDGYQDPKIERAEDEHGLSFNLLLRFYRVLKLNPSSIWVVDLMDRKKYKLARWYWDGTGELYVKKVPEKYKKEVESELVGSSLEYRLQKKKTRAIGRITLRISGIPSK
jgi:hypothetical protein